MRPIWFLLRTKAGARLSTTTSKPIWVGTQRNERISFDWWGTGLVAVFARAPDDRNRLRVCIDGASFQTLDASIQPRRGIIILAEDLAPGRHTVELVAAR